MTHGTGEMNWRRSGVAMVAVAAAFALWGSASANAQTTLSYATYFGGNDPLVRVDLWFMEEVERRSNGEIKFETYLGGSMLGGPEIYPGLSRGAVDIGMSVPAAFHATEYVLSNVTLPFVTDDSVATTYAFNQLLDESPELVAEYENRNVKLLYALGFSENNIWSNDPIRTIEDLEGMRIRSVMSIANALSMLGAVPVSMAFGDAVGGLQRGVIDGFSSAPFLTSISVGLQDFAPYVSDGGGMGVYAVSSTSINLDRWNGLTNEQQAVIDEVASEVPDHYASILSEMVDESVDKLNAAGTTEVVIMEEEEAARLREAVVGPLWNAWLEAAQGAGHDGQAFLDRYRELVVEQEAARDYVPGLTLYMDRYGG